MARLCSCDTSTLLALVLFFLADVLDVSSLVSFYERRKESLDDSYASDGHYVACPLEKQGVEVERFVLERCLVPDFIDEEWEYRRSNHALHISTFIFNAAAWVALTIPICQVAWILSKGGRRMVDLHGLIVLLTLAGSTCQLVARLMLLGVDALAMWISMDWNLDNWNDVAGEEDELGLRVVELIHWGSRGLLLWVESFEWFAFGLVFILLFVSIRREHKSRQQSDPASQTASTFGYPWACLGLAIGFWGLVDVVLSLLRMVSWRRFARLSLLVTAVNTLILLPIWLLMLAIRLHVIRCHFEEEEERLQRQVQERQKQQQQMDRPTGTSRVLRPAVNLVT